MQQWFGKVCREAHGDQQGINPDLGPYHERVERQGDNGVSEGYGKGAQGQARESKETTSYDGRSEEASSYDGRSKETSSYDGRSKGVPAFVHPTGTSSYDGVCDGSPTSKPHLPLAGW